MAKTATAPAPATAAHNKNNSNNNNNNNSSRLVFDDIVAHSEPRRLECNDCYLEHHHGFLLKSNHHGKYNVFVGDVVVVDFDDFRLPGDSNSNNNNNNDEWIQPCYRPSSTGSKYNKKNPWYPLDRPWKVGLVLALYDQIPKQASEFESESVSETATTPLVGMCMSIQWLHRHIHLPAGRLAYQTNFHGKYNSRQWHSILIESNHVSHHVPMARVLPQFVVSFQESPFEGPITVLATDDDDDNDTCSSTTSLQVGNNNNNNNNNNKGTTIQIQPLHFSCPHRFKDLHMTDTEKTTGWTTLSRATTRNNNNDQELPITILQRGWNLPQFQQAWQQQQIVVSQDWWHKYHMDWHQRLSRKKREFRHKLQQAMADYNNKSETEHDDAQPSATQMVTKATSLKRKQQQQQQQQQSRNRTAAAAAAKQTTGRGTKAQQEPAAKRARHAATTTTIKNKRSTTTTKKSTTKKTTTKKTTKKSTTKKTTTKQLPIKATVSRQSAKAPPRRTANATKSKSLTTTTTTTTQSTPKSANKTAKQSKAKKTIPSATNTKKQTTKATKSKSTTTTTKPKRSNNKKQSKHDDDDDEEEEESADDDSTATTSTEQSSPIGSLHEDDQQDLARPLGNPVDTKETDTNNSLTFYNGVEIPLQPHMWDSSLGTAKAQRQNTHNNNTDYWSFHVGDVVAVACDMSTPPRHLANNKNPWYPYNTSWSPAYVVAIFKSHHHEPLEEQQSTNTSSSHYYFEMVIQWFFRWDSFPKRVQSHLMRNNPTLATQLQTLPHMVVESRSFDDSPVTAVLGKLDIVTGPVTDDCLPDSRMATPTMMMPPSLTIQCQYQYYDNNSPPYVTRADGWDKYYHRPRLGKGRFQFLPWTRAHDRPEVDEIPLKKYELFLKRHWSQAPKRAPSVVTKRLQREWIQQNSDTTQDVAAEAAAVAKHANEHNRVSLSPEGDSEKSTVSTASSTTTGLSVAQEGRILAKYNPIHVDKSSQRAYYDSIDIIPPFENYAIRHRDDANTSLNKLIPQSDKHWTLKLGDIVVTHHEDHYKGGGGTAYFEPNTVENPISARENSPTYPFSAPWGIAEVVCMWRVEEDSGRDNGPDQHEMMLEVRWFYRKSEMPGFDRDAQKYIGCAETLEEIIETDHMEDIPASSLLAPVQIFPTTSRLSYSRFEKCMPVLEFSCQKFFSILRRSLIPCGGLDGRVTRGQFHSRYIREDAVLRELIGPSNDNAQELVTQKPSSKSKVKWNEAFQLVIQKLSLTDASKESSESIMVGREREQEAIRSFLRDAICGGSDETGSSMFVAGPPGVGKTGCIRAAIAKLQRDQAAGLVPAFRFIPLNGMEMRHPFEAYLRLLEALKGGMKVRKSEEEAAAALEKYFTTPSKLTDNEEDVVTVVLLDEIDYLVTQKQTVMYNFFDWPRRSAALCASGRFGRRLVVIGVSNTLNLPERLQPRVQSRIGNRRCYFKSYNVKEIQSILKAKIHQASPDLPVFDEDAIIFAARKTAAVSGDVRKAFQICRSAAEMVMNKHTSSQSLARADNGNSPLVRIPDVQRVSREASDSGISKAVAQSTPFEALLLVSMASLSRTTGRENRGFDVEEIMTKMDALAGGFGDEQYTPAPRLEETLFLLQRLAEAQIVQLSTPNNASLSYRSTLTGMGGAWPIASLLLDEINLLLAFRGTKHAQLAQKYLSRSGF